ncbi:hypothetical protein [Cohaesibacter haloalkalitolerans]|nr:hypothetical protein [Cohaesibacter haloalkalitolerans]
MNFFNRAFEKVISAREEQAQRYVNEYMSAHGLEASVDLTVDPRG